MELLHVLDDWERKHPTAARYLLAILLRYVSPYAPFQIVMIIQALLHRALCLRYGSPYLKNNVLYFSYVYLNLNDIWLFA